jgi:hypothetical protein
MGTLVIHAGMSKTGSSSIQSWLADHASWLQAERGVHLLAVRTTAEASPVVVPCEDGSSASSVSPKPLNAAGATKLFTQLNKWLQRWNTVVMTSEGFGSWFYSARARVMLPALDKFAVEHDVRVAYYVRPQHTALEAAWRQWGFREPLKPSEYIRRRVESLHFLTTLDRVRDHAPHVSFVMRPFRSDLLERGDVVADFAKYFLGITDVQFSPSDTWENRGLPLELVNVLRYAPKGLFWASPDDNAKLRKLRRLGVTEWPITQSTKVQESRALLQAFCNREYEPENHVLSERLAWCTDHFVPPAPVDLDDECIDIGKLDELWEPEASKQEQALLFHALSALLQAEPRPSRARTPNLRVPTRPLLYGKGTAHLLRRALGWTTRRLGRQKAPS